MSRAIIGNSLACWHGRKQLSRLSADFSLQENPHKVWQYDYSATNSLAPDQFRIDERSDITGPIGFWHPAANAGPGLGYYAYMAFNPTHQSQVGSK